MEGGNVMTQFYVGQFSLCCSQIKSAVYLFSSMCNQCSFVSKSESLSFVGLFNSVITFRLHHNLIHLMLLPSCFYHKLRSPKHVVDTDFHLCCTCKMELWVKVCSHSRVTFKTLSSVKESQPFSTMYSIKSVP